MTKRTATGFGRSNASTGRCRLRNRTVEMTVWLAVLCTTDAYAGSGFLLRSQSATTLGTAQAGMSTTSEDPSAMIFNPALTAYIPRQWGVGVTPIYSSGKFQPSSATTILGTPLTGGDGGEAARDGYPLNFFAATPVTNNVSVGFTATSLFGLGFKYEPGWVGRYHAGESKLLTLDLMPSLSYRPSQQFTVGLGVNVRYARASTRTAIDFGTIDVLTSGGVLGGIPGANDGSLRTKLDDWDVGYTIGVVFEPTSRTRFGMSYRSKTSMDLRGTASFDNGGTVGRTISAVSGQFTDSDASAPLTLPAAVMFGVRHELSKDWLVMADAQWTEWSTLKQLKLRFANPLQPDIDTPLQWRNSWYVAAGLQYRWSDKWSLRAGVAYDETPTRHETSTPAIPDADSVWLTFGASYRVDNASKVDFAYGHIFVSDNPIALQATAPGNALRGNLNGTIRDSAVNFVSLQYSRRF